MQPDVYVNDGDLEPTDGVLHEGLSFVWVEGVSMLREAR